MPPAVVYSAYFANSRHTSEATAQALEVAYKLLQRAQDIEKGCSGWEFFVKRVEIREGLCQQMPI